LGNSSYFVSLPSAYAVRTVDAADFLVYYFARLPISFTGGLYVGSQPQGDSKPEASWQVRRVPTTRTGHPVT
jgi:hypothetical protein